MISETRGSLLAILSPWAGSSWRGPVEGEVLPEPCNARAYSCVPGPCVVGDGSGVIPRLCSNFCGI